MKDKIKIAAWDKLAKHQVTTEVEADVFGIVAVNKSTQPFTTGYVITHIESGRAMTRLISNKRTANKLAKLIDANADTFSRLSTKSVTKRNRAAGLLLRELWASVGLTPYW